MPGCAHCLVWASAVQGICSAPGLVGPVFLCCCCHLVLPATLSGVLPGATDGVGDELNPRCTFMSAICLGRCILSQLTVRHMQCLQALAST